MDLPGWVRTGLWRSENWCAALARFGEAPDPERTWDLARATEYIDPDRRRALALYLAAWRAGRREALAPAAALARELRAHDAIAELALARQDLIVAGAAFIDAGMFDRAIEALARVTDAPRSTAMEVKLMLSIARRETWDPYREVSQRLARAQQPNEDAPRLFVQAARLARLAALDGTYTNVLSAAVKRCPTDEEVLLLVEDRLLARRGADDLLEHYRARFEAAPDVRDWVERVRAAGSELIARHVQPGLGLRLLRRSLEHAYGARLTDIPRHLATWELLVAHARTARSTRELMPLLVEALQLPLCEADRVYLARLGFEIAWKDVHDAEGARSYAATLAELVPDHPLVRAFLSEEIPQVLVEEPRVMFRPPSQPMRTIPDATPPTPSRTVTPAGAIIPPAALEALRRGKPMGLPAIPPPRVDAAPRAARAVIPIDIVVELSEGEPLSAVVRDLSTSGLFVMTTRALVLGTPVMLELRLPLTNTLVHVKHRIAAKIVRRTDVGYGLAFVDPAPDVTAAIAKLTAEA
jgi:hypothetical protein